MPNRRIRIAALWREDPRSVSELRCRYSLGRLHPIVQHDGHRRDAGRTVANRHGGEFRALLFAKPELDPTAKHDAGRDIMPPTNGRDADAQLLRLGHDGELFLVGEAAPVHPPIARRIALEASVKSSFAASCLAALLDRCLFSSDARMKIRSPIDLPLRRCRADHASGATD